MRAAYIGMGGNLAGWAGTPAHLPMAFYAQSCYAFLMQVTVTIPDELAAQVQARGFILETYLRDLMEERFSREPVQNGQRREAVEAMLHFAETHGTTLGGLDLKSMVHEGHKY
jgi:hypothetical protein